MWMARDQSEKDESGKGRARGDNRIPDVSISRQTGRYYVVSGSVWVRA